MPEIEEKAKAQGWNPDFKGENAKTAEEFLEVGNRIQAVQTERNNKLIADVAKLTDSLDEMKNQQFKVVHEARQESYKKAVADIEAKQLAAVATGDLTEFKALEKEKKAVKVPKVEPTAPAQPAADPIFTDWHKENTWYKANGSDDVSMSAEAYAQVLVSKRPDLKGAEFYKEIEKHVKRVHPDQFGKASPKIDPGNQGGGGGKATGKTFTDLPPEAKKACESQVGEYGITKEGYAKSYFEFNGE